MGCPGFSGFGPIVLTSLNVMTGSSAVGDLGIELTVLTTTAPVSSGSAKYAERNLRNGEIGPGRTTPVLSCILTRFSKKLNTSHAISPRNAKWIIIYSPLKMLVHRAINIMIKYSQDLAKNFFLILEELNSLHVIADKTPVTQSITTIHSRTNPALFIAVGAPAHHARKLVIETTANLSFTISSNNIFFLSREMCARNFLWKERTYVRPVCLGDSDKML